MIRYALILAVSLTALSWTARAQTVLTYGDSGPSERERCASPEPSLEERRAMQAAMVDGAALFGDGAELVVPVAYHVIQQSTRIGVIPDSRLNAQTDSLNRQFEGTGIRFVTVSVDRTVNAEWYNETDLGSPLERVVKRELAIDPERVLNLYFANIDALGWCYFPTSFPEDSSQHGCFMATGSEPDGGLEPYDGGDTATHEIGHFFGLFHTFSNGGAECDDVGDLVDDTPAEAEPNFSGCNLMRDTCPDQPGFDPVTNFMDYSTDACLNDFTPGQITRMASQVSSFKPTLLLGQTSGLGISSAAYEFGEVFVGDTSSRQVFVANFDAAEGASYTVLSATVDDDAFEVSFPDEPTQLGPGERLPMTATFVPTDGVEATATLTITTDDPERPTFEITLTGTGSLAPAATLSPGSISLTLDEGASITRTATLRSVGASALSFSFEPPVVSSFVTGISPESGAILPGQSGVISLDIDATGLAPDVYEEELTITTNDPENPELVLPIELTVTKVVNAEDRTGPLTFTLAGNFPNPFRPSTTIRFTLAESAPTSLVVYDAAGNEVAQLLAETLPAGEHAIPFDASGLSSGTYFYRLASGTERATGSLVLLR